VNAEIDVGFVRRVEGASKFIALRCGVALSEVSPFLQSISCPSFREDSVEDFERLVADIHGVSLKPDLGAKPSYVKTVPAGLSGWSRGAATVAEFLVRNSKTGVAADPMVDVAEVATGTGLPEDDVTDALSDLEDAGLVDVSRSLGESQATFWPKPGLFVEFDRHFVGFDNKVDAVAIVTWLLNTDARAADTDDIAGQFPDWGERRLNSALNYLAESKAVQTSASLGSKWAFNLIMLTDKSRRFARENS